ncbi:hypothetical protein HPB48_025876 [Haemaphysalis longicornis]|uniref:Uncharacterized protein n=1 Tax=Haemaphysalis longicornis TaxID=44386 RepID=A0A9J6HAN4_HAELO|nr:hypothetical protein HPB48_025876 [Haemaphysalis longicornis]
MDECCRSVGGCCREGQRCEPTYRRCVSVASQPRPGGSSSKVLLVPVITRHNQGTSSQGSLASGSGGVVGGDCTGGGHYCWYHERCCHMAHTHQPGTLHQSTSCCTRSNRQCPRIRGCHSPFGVNWDHQQRYDRNRDRFDQRHHEQQQRFNWDREQLMMQRHTLVPSAATRAALPSWIAAFSLALPRFYRRCS